MKTLAEVEGGYVDDPRDKGGETKFGISKRSYPHVDIKALTLDDASLIYRRDFWDRIPFDLPDDLHWMAFDAAVNHGLGRAASWLEDHDTLASFTARRLEFYAALEQWPVFGKGWVRRVAHVLSSIDAWTAEHGTRQVVPTAVFTGLRFADRWLALKKEPVVLRGRFVVRTRAGRVDVKRER